MKNNQKLNEVVLNTVENLADEMIFKTATTFLEDLTKSIPVASIILNLTTAYSNYQTSKNQKQLLSFITQLQSTDPEFIEKFFLNKNNAELGFEILGILDQTYLEKQARMLGRLTKLFKDEKISKQQFDKYTYIITKLNNHLITEIEKLNLSGRDFKQSSNYLAEQRDSLSPEGITRYTHPNFELVSFGFLKETPSPEMWDKITNYERTDEYYYFFESIFTD